MKLLPSLICLLLILHCSFAPPVTPEKDKEHEKDSDVKDDLEEYMEYHKYLKEVVQTLESDPDFRERLEKADEDDVRSGKIAEQLDFVNHNVRTKLDEIKRRELERLRHLATRQFELTNNLDSGNGLQATNEHLDHQNPHTFEIEDLKKLIKKTTADLEAADQRRKEEFKEYEMKKEYEQQHKMETMDETQKKEYMENLKKEEEAKKHHKPIHHPGSKQQLEEVWEKQDHMQDQQFDPKTFFMLHDVDGNGVWDPNEVKALFIKELDKLYGPGGPNKDLHERAEEMERMREHVFKENDKNRDGLIDFNEFLSETKSPEFNQDEGWKPVDENEIYTRAEYEAFERRRQEEFKFLLQRGLVDAHGTPIPGAHHQIQQALREFDIYYQQMQNQYYPQHHGQAPMYPNQVPPQAYPQAPGQGYQQQQFQPQYQGQPQAQFQGQPQAQFQGQQQGQFQNQQPQQGQFQGQQQQQAQFQNQQPQQAQFQAQQPQQAQFQGQPPQQQAQQQGQFQAQPPQQFQSPQGQAQAPNQPPQQPPQQPSQPQAQAQPQMQQPQAQMQPEKSNPPVDQDQRNPGQPVGQNPQNAQNTQGQAPPA